MAWFKKQTPLPIPSEADREWFEGVLTSWREHVKRKNLATLRSDIHQMSPEEYNRALLVYVDLLGRVSTREVAENLPFLPFRGFEEPWSEATYEVVRAALALGGESVVRAYEDNPRLVRDLQTAELIDSASVLEFLIERVTLVKRKNLQEIVDRGLATYTPSRWKDLPQDYPPRSYFYNTAHRELTVMEEKSNFSAFAKLLSSKNPLPVHSLVETYVRDWNRRIETTLQSQPEATQARDGILSETDMKEPFTMSAFMLGAFALEMENRVSSAYERLGEDVSRFGGRPQVVVVPQVVEGFPDAEVVEHDDKSVLIYLRVNTNELAAIESLGALLALYAARLEKVLAGVSGLHPSTLLVASSLGSDA